MFAELLSYNPADVDPKIREQVASILQSRAELLTAQAEVSALRARAWAGEEGAQDLTDLKAANLTKIREDHGKLMRELLMVAVDIEGLVETLPAIGLALLQKFNVPLPALLEAVGADFDAIKLMVDQGRKLIEDL